MLRFFNQFSSKLFISLGLIATFSACDLLDDKEEPIGGAPKSSLKLTTVAKGLDTPWQIVFLPDGKMLVTQRPGRIALIEKGKPAQVNWLRLDSVVAEVGESGLLGITLDPQFEQNGYFYITYTQAVDQSPIRLVNKLVRYIYTENGASFDQVILDSIRGNTFHNGGSLRFGPDGKLYFPMGETFEPRLAQNLNSLNGKILRLNADRTVPSDNPFPGSYVYSYGHRNVQGIDFQPGTNLLFATEHGPSLQQGCCQDEINIIRPGQNYGWPLITGIQTRPGLVSPFVSSGNTTTWAPGGAVFVKKGPWSVSFVFAALFGKALYRLNLAPNNAPAGIQEYLKDQLGRLRTVEQGPDGNLYIATSNNDGRGVAQTPDDDRIIMVEIVK